MATKINSDEVLSVLRNEIETYGQDLRMEEVGSVLEVGDGIARIFGLESAMAGELLEFPGGIMGMVFNLEETSVGAVILGDFLEIHEGATVKRTGRVVEVPCGEALLGRVVDALGRPIDDGPPIKAAVKRPIEWTAPGVAGRQPVTKPMQTGIKAIDAMTPVGRGQRELIIGDRSTGKTAIALDTIINQKGGDVICVYVAIGQKGSTVARLVEELRQNGAMEYTIVVAATSSDPAPLQFIAPYAGCAMAEYFMYEHDRDTLCVYDDLSKQAAAYRQLSLLLRRPPGREAYPGDVFYLHSRLLERSVRLLDEIDGEGNTVRKRGSLTALPVIETQEGEVSAYIPTNVISITDGQIYLEPNLFFGGIRPAINVGISVSRVGGKAQAPAMKQVAGSLKLDLASYWELEAFSQLGTDLDKASQAKLDRGKRMVELLKQGQFKPLPMEEQVVVMFAGSGGHFDKVEVDLVRKCEAELLEHMRDKHAGLLATLKETGKLDDETESSLKAICEEFQDKFVASRGATGEDG